MAELKEIENYRRFTKPAELHKALNTLHGIVAGITMEGGASNDEMQELVNWCVLHRHLIDRHPFSELIPMIEQAQSDGILSGDEAQDILWLCNNFMVENEYYDTVTSALQYLAGLLHGILADNDLSDKEIHLLQDWVESHDYLRGSYPFDEIDSLLTSVLADGIVDENERNMLKAFFSNFIDLSVSTNLNQPELETLRKEHSVAGICAVAPEVILADRTFCFTGQSDRAIRSEIAEEIIGRGGNFTNSVTKKVDYLIVGNAGNPCWAYSCYGRKVEEAMKLRQNGGKIQIVNELDFWDMFA